jgi:gamma-glutamylcyclotransferase (GGCT)/AIG2-like uncharacterized protein YtfP
MLIGAQGLNPTCVQKSTLEGKRQERKESQSFFYKNHLMSSNFIFIYGTLLSSLNHPMHDLLKRYAELTGKGTIRAKLYDLGRYPGVVLSNNQADRVKGEIYKITDSEKLFPVLDRYEGCSDEFPEPHQYLRKKVPVLMDDGRRMDTWVYLFNWDTLRHTHIESGNYLENVKGSRN